MTRDEIRKMAKKAGLAGVKLSAGLDEMRTDMWERFAALVAAAEREACAKVKDQLLAALKTAEAGLVWYQGMHPEHVDGSDDEAMDEIAKAIADAEQLELALQPPRVED